MSGAKQQASGTGRVGRISAVVCNYNGESYLHGCLDALLAEGDELDEILVVDNGSTDGSLATLAKSYPNVKVLALPENGGPCVARNAGLREARNRWVLAVDNDAILRPGTAAKLRAALEADAGAVLAQPRSVVSTEPDRIHYDGAEFHYVGLYALRNFFRPIAEAEGEGTVPVSGFVSICGLMDREIVLELGGYDEQLFILFEDFDLSLRLRIAGHRLLSVEDALVDHDAGTPGISFRQDAYPAKRAYFHSRNRWLLLAKCYSLRSLIVASPGLAVYELVWLLFTLRSGHLLRHLHGKASFVKRLPQTLALRRIVQRSRRCSDRDLLVPGPLTLSPQLVEKPLAAKLARGLDAVLSGWWRLAGRWAG